MRIIIQKKLSILCNYTKYAQWAEILSKTIDFCAQWAYNIIKDKGYGNPKNRNEHERKMNYEKGYIYSKRRRGYIH